MPRKARIKKRPYGEGSISEDKTRGRFVGRIFIGKDDNGKPVFTTRTGKTEAIVAAKLDAIVAAKKENRPPEDHEVTVTMLLEHWIENVLPEAELRPKTVQGYTYSARHYVEPILGTIPVIRLTADDVDRMKTNLRNQGLAPNTIRLARSALRKALAVAVSRHYAGLTHNVVADTKGLKITRAVKADDWMTEAEVKAMLKTARGDRLEAFANFLLTIGSRKTETLMLRWSDIDLDNAVVTFRRENVKNDASAAPVAMPAGLVEILREHKARQDEEKRNAKPGRNSGDWVFTGVWGRRLDPQTAMEWWHDLAIRAGVERRRLHAARHTAASLLLNNGVPLKVVQLNHRHSSIKITGDIYAHVSPELQRTTATTLDKVLYGDEGPEPQMDVA